MPSLPLRAALPPLLILLSACSNTPSMPSMPDVTSMLSPYRIDVRQGNYVDQAMVARLRPGMTREQVRFALGSPLLADMFHANRWDYVYRLQPGSGPVHQRRLIVFFEDDKLARVGGDVVAETDPDARDAPNPSARVVDVPAAK